MKTKEQLVKSTLRSEAGFKLAVIDLLADIRNSVVTAILLNQEELGLIQPKPFLRKAVEEMKRVITEEAKTK